MNKDISIFNLTDAMKALCNSLKNGADPNELLIPEEFKASGYTDTDILVMAWLENHRDGDYPTDQISTELKVDSVDIDTSLSHLEMKGVLVPCGGEIQDINT